MLSLYRALIGLRNANAALNSGRVEGVCQQRPDSALREGRW